jgi:hypothetical protein
MALMRIMKTVAKLRFSTKHMPGVPMDVMLGAIVVFMLEAVVGVVMFATVAGVAMLVHMAGTVMLAAMAWTVVLIAGAAISPSNGGDDRTLVAGDDYQNPFTLSSHDCCEREKSILLTLKL